MPNKKPFFSTPVHYSRHAEHGIVNNSGKAFPTYG